ncbi:hypothetical protein ACN4EE_18425 [Geminocystis sp. CENA526]|uniref:hypothetical protein n=1 Tax=Geminocystis sp. CENA526 TaxID=1355871 RepID=UPI003D6F502B
MKPSVYIETSVVSYLTARPSRDLISASRQQTWNCKHIANATMRTKIEKNLSS